MLYPRRCITRHYLNSFRGEPAISRFVWPFTPTHSSSTHFCNSGSFGPPAGVTQPSAWPWVDHLVSGLRPATEAPCSDSLSLRLPYAVKLATQRKSLTHYTKGTPSSQLDWSSRVCVRICIIVEFFCRTDVRQRTLKANQAGTPTVCMHAVSGSISLPFRGSFRLSLTVLVHYRSTTSI